MTSVLFMDLLLSRRLEPKSRVSGGTYRTPLKTQCLLVARTRWSPVAISPFEGDTREESDFDRPSSFLSLNFEVVLPSSLSRRRKQEIITPSLPFPETEVTVVSKEISPGIKDVGVHLFNWVGNRHLLGFRGGVPQGKTD